MYVPSFNGENTVKQNICKKQPKIVRNVVMRRQDQKNDKQIHKTQFNNYMVTAIAINMTH